MAKGDILSVVGSFAADDASGTVMAVFDDNSMGRFYIINGVLATARYRSKEGVDAINAASQLEVKSSKFHQSADLVRSAEILDIDLPGPGAPTAPTQVASARVAATPAARSATAKAAMSHIARARIGDLLAEYIGPVAPLIMADLDASLSGEAAIDVLSDQIDNVERAAEFVRSASRFI